MSYGSAKYVFDMFGAGDMFGLLHLKMGHSQTNPHNVIPTVTGKTSPATEPNTGHSPFTTMSTIAYINTFCF